MGLARRFSAHHVWNWTPSVPRCVRIGESDGLQEPHPCPRAHQRQYRSRAGLSAAPFPYSPSCPRGHNRLPDVLQCPPAVQAVRPAQLNTGACRKFATCTRTCGSNTLIRHWRRDAACRLLAYVFDCPWPVRNQSAAESLASFASHQSQRADLHMCRAVNRACATKRPETAYRPTCPPFTK